MYTSFVYIIAHLNLMSSPFDLTRASWHPSHVVRGYPLTTSPPLPTMTKRHVARQKDEGGKPHFYKTTGKSGCRVYVGRKYLGYFASMQAAHTAMRGSKPIEKATVIEKEVTVAEQKVYKYVLTRKTKKGPMYQGAIWTKTKVGKQTQWTKKFFLGPSPRRRQLHR